MNQKTHITIWLLFALFLIGLFIATYTFVAYLGNEAHEEVRKRESTTSSYLQ